MDKSRFIFRVQEMFSSLKDRSYGSVLEEYSVVLVGNIDYEKLFNIFCKEWDRSTRPLPSELVRFVKRAQIVEFDELTGDAKEDLKMVVEWFNSEDYQYYHKEPPHHICLLIKRHRLTENIINRALTEMEF